MPNVFYIVVPDCRAEQDNYSTHGVYLRDLPDRNLLSSLAKKAKTLVSLMRSEEDVQFYYSRDAILELKSYTDGFCDYPYKPELMLMVNAFVALGGKDYKKSQMFDDDFTIYYGNAYERGGIVSTAANHVIKTDVEFCNVSLINADALTIKDKSINFSTSHNSAHRYILECILFGLKDIAKHIACNRRPRRDFFPSPKHGVNMPEDADMGGASPLMCSEEDARLYLQYGFSDREKRVWTYDRSRKKFITFQKQENNVWHGYHLVKEKDVERERIPVWLRALLMEIAPKL